MRSFCFLTIIPVALWAEHSCSWKVVKCLNVEIDQAWWCFILLLMLKEVEGYLISVAHNACCTCCSILLSVIYFCQSLSHRMVFSQVSATANCDANSLCREFSIVCQCLLNVVQKLWSFLFSVICVCDCRCCGFLIIYTCPCCSVLVLYSAHNSTKVAHCLNYATIAIKHQATIMLVAPAAAHAVLFIYCLSLVLFSGWLQLCKTVV